MEEKSPQMCFGFDDIYKGGLFDITSIFHKALNLF